jgi:hypothetical protein
VAWRETPDRLDIKVQTPCAEADLDITAFIADAPAPLPPGSPFADLREARLFAGPLPYTFDYEPQTHSIILIEGERDSWHPKPIKVEVRKVGFFGRPSFKGITPVLANAFLVSGIPYRWKQGVREPLPKDQSAQSGAA